MFKKRLMSLITVVSIAATMITANVSAAPSVLVNTFNESSYSSTWGSTITNGQIIQTDDVPAGYALQNTTAGKRVWSAKNIAFNITTNDYYIDFYTKLENADGYTALSTTNNVKYGVFLRNAQTINVMAGFMYSSDLGKWRPFLKIGENDSNYTSDEPEDAKVGIELGKLYKVSLKIVGGTTNNYIMDIYDAETAEKISTVAHYGAENLTLTNIIIDSNNTALGGRQTLSDLKVTEVAEADKDSYSKVYTDARYVSFGGIEDIITAETTKIELPATYTTDNGSTVTYSSSNTSVIDNEGNVYHDASDRNVFIQATVTNGDSSIVRTYKVTVAGTGSAFIAKENFADVTGNLSGEYLPSANGFKMSWKTDSDLTTDSTIKVQEINGKNYAVLEGISTSQANIVNAYNQLSHSVNLSSDATYYLKSIMGFESGGWNTEANTNTYGKFGLAGANEISTVWMYRYDTDKTPYVGIKAGAASPSYMDKADMGGTVNTGSLYNILMKIDASSTADDTISLKLWPLGTQEPKDWSFTKTANLSGTSDKVFYQTNAKTGYDMYFTDFAVEVYVGEDVTTVENAMANVVAYAEGTAELEDVTFPIASSVAEESHTNLTALKNSAYVSEIIFASGDERVVKAGDITGQLKVIPVISNDSGEAQNFDKSIFVALYDANGSLKEVQTAVLAENTAPVGDSKPVLTFTSSVTANDSISVFVWNDDLSPVMYKTTLEDTLIRNY